MTTGRTPQGGSPRPRHARALAGLLAPTLALVSLASGCVGANTVACDWGLVCPGGTTCDGTHLQCVFPEQLQWCNAAREGRRCSYGTVLGVCDQGVCLSFVCGNGILDPGEQCDEGDVDDCDGCSSICRLEECGNGVSDCGEQCDDGNLEGGDGCGPTCLTEECGNGYVDTALGEACDDGADNSLDPDAPCRPSCQLPACGDHVVDPGAGEVCDDGNTVSGDGCRGDCGQDETLCGNGHLDPGEVCDDGNTESGDGCRGDCAGSCGNLTVESGEECDDGNLRSHDGCSSGCTLEAPTWTRLFPGDTAPPARFMHALSYDGQRHRVVLYGGNTGASVGGDLDDTWELGPDGWVEVTPTGSPGARSAHALAWDAAHQRTVLTGGWDDQGTLEDAWAYNGSAWTLLTATGTLGAHALHVLCDDPVRQRVVLFGGQSDDRLWELDGAAWTPLTWVPSPVTRWGAALTFDPDAGVAVLFGGTAGAGPSAYLDDTWTLDASGWHEVTAAAAPDARSGHGLAADPVRGAVVLFGGFDGTQKLGDTWELVGSTWTERTPSTAPTARHQHALVYAPVLRGVVLFGGEDSSGYVNDTWRYRWDSGWPDEDCAAAGDEDADGLADCADPDCEGMPCATGQCQGGTCQ